MLPAQLSGSTPGRSREQQNGATPASVVSEEWYRALFEYNLNGVLLVDAVTGAILTANPAACQMLGRTEAELASANRADVTNAADARLAVAMATLRQTGQFRGELTYCRADGTHFPAEVANSIFTGQDGRAVVCNIFADISERVQAQTALRVQHELSEALSGCDDIDAAMALILDAAIMLPAVDAGGIYLAQPEGDLVLVVHRGLSPAFVASVRRYDVDSPPARLARSGQTHYRTAQQTLSLQNRVYDDEGVRAVAIIPVMHQGELQAVLNLASLTVDAIPANIQQALETMAMSIGSALRRLRAERARRRAEQELLRLAAIVDSAGEAIMGTDAHGNIVTWNSAAEALFDYSAAEIIGQHITVLVPPGLDGKMVRVFAQPMPERWHRQYETFARTKEGQTVEIGISPFPVKDMAGQVIGYAAVVHDIGQRKAMERTLRQSEQKYNTLFHSSPVAMLVTRLEDGWVVDVNDAGAELAGYSRAELIGRTLVELGIFAQATRATLLQQQTDGHIEQTEVAIAHKSGATINVLFSADFIDLDGIPCMQASIIDISARKEIERMRALLSGIVESSTDAIVSCDVDGQILTWNVAAERLFGISATETTGRHCSHFLSQAQHEAWHRMSERAIQGAITTAYEMTVATSKNQSIEISVSTFPLRDAQGQVIGAASIARDISDRIRAEEARRIAAERLRLALHAARGGMWDLQAGRDELVVNDRWYALYGYTPGAITPSVRHWIERIHPDDAPEVLQANAEFFSSGSSDGHIEYRIFTPAGELRWLQTFANVVERSADGQAARVVGVDMDVTPRKHAEMALVESERKYRDLYDNSPDMYFINSLPQDIIVDCNRTLALTLGYARDELIGQPSAFLYEPAAIPKLMAERQHLLSASRTHSIETQLRRKDGTIVDVLMTGSADRTPDGTSYLSRVVMHYVTARLQREAQLRDALQTLQLATSAADLGLWRWRFADGRLEWDDRMCRLYGVTAAERAADLYYDLWRARIHPEDLAQVEKMLDGAGRLATDWDGVFRIVLPGGQIRYIHSVAVIDYDHDGAPRQVIGLNRDVTEQQQYERMLKDSNVVLEEQVAARTAELRATVAELERANIGKDAFMAAISHELRTPLTGILGIGELLQSQARGPLNVYQERYVQMLMESGYRLLDTVTAVLDYTNLLAGQMSLQHQCCRLIALAEACVNALQAAARSKEQTVVLDVTPVDLTMNGDAEGITKIIATLLENALKFTPVRGLVGIDIAEASGGDAICIEVWDTGIGMSRDQVAHLFEPFVQGDQSMARRFEGLGLGLALVHKLVALMGGGIVVESELGKGSRFVVTLPAA